jgi:protein-L-isoaspartate O-methyltransferase
MPKARSNHFCFEVIFEAVPTFFETGKLRIAAYLYKHAFAVYKILYYRFKRQKDAFNLMFIKATLKEGDAAIDIGANIGFYTEYMALCCGNSGTVWAFEPDAVNFKHLKKATTHLKQVTCKQQAVASSNGSLTLYASDLLNIDHRTYKPAKYAHSYSVQKLP